MKNIPEGIRPPAAAIHTFPCRDLSQNRLVFRNPQQEAVTLDLTQLDPITFVLDLPGFGKIELGLERDGNTVRFCLRAARWIEVRRGEIDESRETANPDSRQNESCGGVEEFGHPTDRFDARSRCPAFSWPQSRARRSYSRAPRGKHPVAACDGRVSTNPNVRFLAVPGASHFSISWPGQPSDFAEGIAGRRPGGNLAFAVEELSRPPVMQPTRPAPAFRNPGRPVSPSPYGPSVPGQRVP